MSATRPSGDRGADRLAGADAAGTAGEIGGWDAEISAVSEFAECYSNDYLRHDAHLRHMDLLARAGRLEELAARGTTDVHARRRLDRFLYEQDRDGDLRHRARHGDRYALYMLVRLLRERGDQSAARQAVVDIDATDTYASELAEQP